MKKSYLFLAATAILALASCSENTYLGENEENAKGTSGAISFGSGFNAVTRGENKVGYEAAKLLGEKFIVGGFKGTLESEHETDPVTTTVFDNYIVQWDDNSAGTSRDNTSDWKYVGITAAAPATVTGAQTIKYWDYQASQYNFIAYSTGGTDILASGTVGDASTAHKVLVSAINAANTKTEAYSLGGNIDELKKCYIADMVTAYEPTDYNKEVQFSFRNLAAKVRIALYETIPGYSVTNVNFYTDATSDVRPTGTGTGTLNNTTATLFTTGTANNNKFFTQGSFKVYFPTIGSTNKGKSDYNKAHVSFTANGDQATSKGFGSINYTLSDDTRLGTTDDDKIYLAQTSKPASFAGTAGDNYYSVVLPNEDGTVLTLRINYTLVSNDHSGETITVHGATAYVPIIYAAWKPNYAYTYIFKISDNTNGWTKQTGADAAGLYPVTFDAVVADAEDGTQSTITTVATPSITTYQKGHNYSTDGPEYKASTENNIYVQVMDGNTLKNDLDSKGQLYTLSRAATEAEVLDALNVRLTTPASGYDITGRNGLSLKKATSATDITAIPGPDGNNITVTAKTAASFAATAGIYAYVYTISAGSAGTPITTAVQLTGNSAPDDFTTAYYTDEACTAHPTAGDYVKNNYYYQQYNVNTGSYGVKVITVVN